MIPADLRMLESRDMKIDKSILTGDNEPQSVTIDVKTSQKDIFNATHLVFFGCVCKEGSGKGVVIGTGNKTALSELEGIVDKKKIKKSILK